MRLAGAILGMIGAGLGVAKGLFWVGFSLLLGLSSMVTGMEGGGLDDNSYLQLVLACDAATVLAAAVGFLGAGLVLAAGGDERRSIAKLRKGMWLTLAAAAGITIASTVYAVLFPIVVPGRAVGISLIYWVSAFGPAAIVAVAAAMLGVEVRRRGHLSDEAIQS